MEIVVVTTFQKCHLCNQLFPNCAELDKHVENDHNEQANENLQTFHQCRICDKKFKQYLDLEAHCKENGEGQCAISKIGNQGQERSFQKPTVVKQEPCVQHYYSSEINKPNKPTATSKQIQCQNVGVRKTPLLTKNKTKTRSAAKNNMKTVPLYKYQHLQEKYWKLLIETRKLRKQLKGIELENRKQTETVIEKEKHNDKSVNDDDPEFTIDKFTEESTSADSEEEDISSPIQTKAKSNLPMKDIVHRNIEIRSIRQSRYWGVNVQKKKKHLRIYNKQSACYYCGILSTKASKHYMTWHQNESKVAKILTLTKNGDAHMKKCEWTLLRFEGNHKHNQRVLKNKAGELLVCRRQIGEYFSIEDYGPCPQCKGWFLKSGLAHHKNNSCISNRLVEQEIPTEADELKANCVFQKLTHTMRNDVISNTAKSDAMIMKIGEVFYGEAQNRPQKRINTTKHIRTAAILLIKLRELDGSEKSLDFYLKPEKFDLVKEAAFASAGAGDSSMNEVDIIYLKNIGRDLEKWIAIIEDRAREEGDEDKLNQCKEFLQLYDEKWWQTDDCDDDNDDDEKEDEDNDYEKGDENADADNHGTTSTTKQGNNKNTKTLVCLYCEKKLRHRIACHLKKQHFSESEVTDAFSKTGVLRKNAISLIKSKGNFKHNVKMIRARRSDIVVANRPRSGVIVASDYLPCIYCYAFCQKHNLWKHVKGCQFKPEGEEVLGSKVQEKAKIMLGSAVFDPTGVDMNEIENALNVKSDKVVRGILNDRLLLEFGRVLMEELGGNRLNDIIQRMRQLSQLKMILNEQLDHIDLYTAISGKHFDSVISAVQKLASLKETTSGVKIFAEPARALRVGRSLTKVSLIKFGIALQEHHSEGEKEAAMFSQLLSSKWHERVGSVALSSIDKMKHSKSDVLPVTTDLVFLKKYLIKNMTQLCQDLQDQPDYDKWKHLSEITLCAVQLMNNHRGSGSNAELLLVRSYKKRSSLMAREKEKLYSDLSELEKQIFSRIEIVPCSINVLLTADTKAAIDILLSTRNACGILATNNYIFADKQEGHLKIKTALQSVTKDAELDDVELLNEKIPRKYISTVFQILNLTNDEMKWLLDHLGEHVQLHNKSNNLQESYSDIAKASKLLLAIENGLIERYRGQSMEDLNLHEIDLLHEDKVVDDELNGSTANVKRNSVSKAVQENEVVQVGTEVVEEGKTVVLVGLQHGNSAVQANEVVEEGNSAVQDGNKVVQENEVAQEENEVEEDKDKEVTQVLNKDDSVMEEEKEDDSEDEGSEGTGSQSPTPEKVNKRVAAKRKISSDEEWFEGEEVKKRNTSFTVIKRKRWTPMEKNIFWANFQKYIERKTFPPGIVLSEKGKLLPGRTVAQIRTRIHNFISGKQLDR